jgi:hypothetical protein
MYGHTELTHQGVFDLNRFTRPCGPRDLEVNDHSGRISEKKIPEYDLLGKVNDDSRGRWSGPVSNAQDLWLSERKGEK